MTWEEFQELFVGKYFSDTARHAKGSGVPRAEVGDYDWD